jgi:hypothetical protein
MLPEDIHTEINSLQLQIEDNEKNFDIALPDPGKLEYAKQLYRHIKILEGRLAELRTFLDQKSGTD